jgi:hypothetical protein
MAQRKNRLVIKMNGTSNRRSVMGMEGLSMNALAQGSIQMHITTIHKNVLARDVFGLVRQQK